MRKYFSTVEMAHILGSAVTHNSIPNLAGKMDSVCARTDFLTCSLIFSSTVSNEKYFWDTYLCFALAVLQNTNISEIYCRISAYFENISTRNAKIQISIGKNTDKVFSHIYFCKCYILSAVWKPINVSWQGLFICTWKCMN
jgi:hypothetical protein